MRRWGNSGRMAGHFTRFWRLGSLQRCCFCSGDAPAAVRARRERDPWGSRPARSELSNTPKTESRDAAPSRYACCVMPCLSCLAASGCVSLMSVARPDGTHARRGAANTDSNRFVQAFQKHRRAADSWPGDGLGSEGPQTIGEYTEQTVFQQKNCTGKMRVDCLSVGSL